MMWDAEASRSKTCLLLKKKKNTFASENNLESMRGSLNPQGSLNLKVHLVYEILVNV